MPERPIVTGLRPLRRVAEGHWRSRDERWSFMRHWGDPKPQRWYAYLDGDEWPILDGTGDTRLSDVVATVEDWICRGDAARGSVEGGGEWRRPN